MPRGKYVNHKGRSRHFTSPEELEQESKKDAAKKKHRSKDDSDEESEEEKDKSGSGSENENSDNSEDDSEDDEDNHKAKGVSNLIQIENPNRVQRKTAQKVTKVNVGEQSNKPELSRREREEIDKQRAQALYQKLHAEGRTEQARADLARLAIIKQHRAEAAARREAEKKEKEERKKATTANR